MRSATTEAFSKEDGTVRPPIVELYRNLAKGGVGLIVTGHLYVMEGGKAHEGMAGISQEKHITGLREISRAVHENEGIIVAQLNHAGLQHAPDRSGPSECQGNGWKSRAMSEDEVVDVVAAFGEAADRAMQAEFDGIQIHGAHGYLISQFLSKLVNKRDDRWGGSIDNRIRLLREVCDEVRSRIDSAPIMLKMNCDDFSPDGFTIEDSIYVARQIVKKGLSLLEVSGGGIGRQSELSLRAKHSDPLLDELPFAGHAAKIREATIPAPMALVNGFTNISTMKKVIETQLVDMVSMSRPFIRNPDLINLLNKGEQSVTCVRCDKCLGPDVFGKEMLRCQLD